MKTFPWLLLAVLALSGASASAPQVVNCAKRSVCTNKDGKVCGSDGQTYANKCKFEAAYCANPSDQLYIESDGVCKKTQKANANANAAASEAQTEAVTPAPTTTTTANVPAQADANAEVEAVTPVPTTMQAPPEVAVKVEGKDPATPAPTTSKIPPAAEVAQDEEVVEDPAAAKEPAETEVVTTIEQVEELSPSKPATAMSDKEAVDETAEDKQVQSSVPANASPASASGSGSGGGVGASYAACQVKCPTDWIPVCGNDGETYANECLRILAKCRDPSLTTAHTGECVKDPAPTDTTSSTAALASTITTSLEVTASGSVKAKCNHICPKLYEPVCGSDSITYANQCLLDYAACRTGRVMKIADGKCAKRKRGKTCVPEICMGVEDALCGSDGTTYLNVCMFENAQCLTPLLTILHDGECDENTQLKCATLTCPKFTECREDDAIDVAYCADVCAAERCGENEECQLLDAECFTAPCSPVATCVSIETSSETEIF